MPNKDNHYYYMDINLHTMEVTDVGESNTATHTGDTEDPQVHRVFLPVGQYNKLVRKLKI